MDASSSGRRATGLRCWWRTWTWTSAATGSTSFRCSRRGVQRHTGGWLKDSRRFHPQPFEDPDDQATDFISREDRVVGVGDVKASLGDRTGQEEGERAERLRLDDAAVHRLAQGSPDADGPVARLDEVHDVPAEHG